MAHTTTSFDYKPLTGPYHFQHKPSDPSGVYHAWRVLGGKPVQWLGVIRRVDGGWVSPKLGLRAPVASRVAAADWLAALQAKNVAEAAIRRAAT